MRRAHPALAVSLAALLAAAGTPAGGVVFAMLLPLALDQPIEADPTGPGMFVRLEALLRAKGQGLESRAIPLP